MGNIAWLRLTFACKPCNSNISILYVLQESVSMNGWWVTHCAGVERPRGGCACACGRWLILLHGS